MPARCRSATNLHPLRSARRLRRHASRRLRRAFPETNCGYSRSATAVHIPFHPRYAQQQRRIVVGIADAFGAGAGVVGSGSSSGGFGRVASRPGYPAEPAARSRPFGRVSLAPPLPSVAARSACPAAGFARRRCRNDTLVIVCDGINLSRRSSRPALALRPALGASLGSSRVTASPFIPLRATASDTGSPTRAFPRQCASHHCTRLTPLSPPLKRRGGSHSPPSPAPIFPSLKTPHQNHPGRRRRLAFTPHAACCHWRHTCARSAVPCDSCDMRRHQVDGTSVCFPHTWNKLFNFNRLWVSVCSGHTCGNCFLPQSYAGSICCGRVEFPRICWLHTDN